MFLRRLPKFLQEHALRLMFNRYSIFQEVVIGFKTLWDTIVTLHEKHEYRQKPNVQRIQKNFESGELDKLM